VSWNTVPAVSRTCFLHRRADQLGRMSPGLQIIETPICR